MAIATERISQGKARGDSTLATLNKERDELIQRQVEIQNQLNRDTKELQQIERGRLVAAVVVPCSGWLTNR